MRILQVHNYYQRWGGEDGAIEPENSLLESRGHQVQLFSRHNDEIQQRGLLGKSKLFLETTWSSQSYQDLKQTIQEFRPDIVHFQNTFPLLSPSSYYACAHMGVPCIQTLRNFRLLCPKADFMREGKVCEDCLEGSLWNSIRHACYRDSKIQTAAVAVMLKTHRLLRTWKDKVNAFIVVSEFSRRKFIDAGFSEQKIEVRADFLQEPPGEGIQERHGAVFVGRLSPEKGLETLLEGWQRLPHVPLKVIGEGPLRPWVEAFIRRHGLNHITVMGHIPPEDILGIVKTALVFVMPSIWYEGLPRTIIEAFAVGTPVVASRLGAMAEMVTDHKTGLLFTPGDPGDLARQVQCLVESPDDRVCMGRKARADFEEKYTPDRAYHRLMEIYEKVLKENAEKSKK